MLPTMLGRAARPSGEGPAPCALCAKGQGSAGLLFQQRCEGRHKGTPLMLQPHLLHTYLSAYVHTLHTYTRTHTHTHRPLHINAYTPTHAYTDTQTPAHIQMRKPLSIHTFVDPKILPVVPIRPLSLLYLFQLPPWATYRAWDPLALELCTLVASR